MSRTGYTHMPILSKYSADWETVALTHKQAQKAVRRRLLASKIKCKQHKMENIYKNQPSKCFMRKEIHLTEKVVWTNLQCFLKTLCCISLSSVFNFTLCLKALGMLRHKDFLVRVKKRSCLWFCRHNHGCTLFQYEVVKTVVSCHRRPLFLLTRKSARKVGEPPRGVCWASWIRGH